MELLEVIRKFREEMHKTDEILYPNSKDRKMVKTLFSFFRENHTLYRCVK